MITIAELRARNNKMSQYELAEKMNVKQSTVSRWEKDITTISGDRLKRLCLLFNVSSDELLGISEENDKKISI